MNSNPLISFGKYVWNWYICRLLRIPFLIRNSDSHSQASLARYMCIILHCLVNKTIKSWVLFRCWLNNLLAEWATVNRARFGVKWPSVKFLSSRRQLITWATVDYDVISRSLMTSLSPIAPCSSSLHLEQSSLLEYQLLWDGGLIWYSREIGLCTSRAPSHTGRDPCWRGFFCAGCRGRAREQRVTQDLATLYFLPI